MVYHLAGVNRPKMKRVFEGNVVLTENIIKNLPSESCKLVFTSSIHAEKDHAYGQSKKQAEEVIKEAAKNQKLEAYIYRLPGLFGKWSRPNYNSVVATFCHNIAHDKEVRIDDPSSSIDLVYIDDVVEHFVSLLDTSLTEGAIHTPEVTPIYEITVGNLAEKLMEFRSFKTSLFLPKVENSFEKKLYSTYLSYLDEDDFSYGLEVHKDDRGRLFEWIKSDTFGQVFISYTKPGVTRGNHYHHTKTEKFLVIQGKASIQFREINTDEVIEYNVSGVKPCVLDIPPGYTHNITNTGEEELITLFWANEIFDEDNTDTTYKEV